jgi:hypothetical protein
MSLPVSHFGGRGRLQPSAAHWVSADLPWPVEHKVGRRSAYNALIFEWRHQVGLSPCIWGSVTTGGYDGNLNESLNFCTKILTLNFRHLFCAKDTCESEASK